VEHPYPCDVCHKTFRDTDGLKVHQCVRTEQLPYRCDVCNKPFSENGREHQNLRTGEHSYSCDMCNKTFKILRNLKAHQLVHTGDRPHSCDVCNKTFSKKVTLRYISGYILGSVHIAVICVMKHSGTKVT